jgi:hypothetical protein
MEGGKLITTADQAGTSALRKNMQDMKYKFKFVYDLLFSPPRIYRI